jgi:hypothetical protein
MRKLSISILILACAAGAHGEAVKSLRLTLPPKPSPVVENIGRVFARQVESRCEARLVVKGDAPLTVELAIEPGVGAEGFRVVDSAPPHSPHQRQRRPRIALRRGQVSPHLGV